MESIARCLYELSLAQHWISPTTIQIDLSHLSRISPSCLVVYFVINKLKPLDPIDMFDIKQHEVEHKKNTGTIFSNVRVKIL